MASAIAAFLTAIYVWATMRMPGSTVGGLLIDFGALWSLGYLCQLLSEEAGRIMFWFSLQTACSYLVPSLFIIYLLRYFEINASVTKQVIPLIVLPVVFALLTVSNEYHHLIWGESSVLPNNQVVIQLNFPGYLVITYLFLEVIFVTYLFVRMVMSECKLYKLRAITFLIAIAIYATSFTLSIMGYLPDNRNITSIIFNILCVSIVIVNPEALYKRDVLPIAYESVIEEMKDAAIITDHEFKIVFLNDAAKELTGFEQMKFLSMKLWDVLPDVFYVKKKREIEEKSGVEYRDRVYDLRITAIEDWLGEERTRIFVIRDITELVEYSKALEKIIEKTRMDLRDAERLAAIGETTMMVGHDLRNPLQVLKGISYSLKKKHMDNPRALSIFDKVDKSIFYMDKIVSDLQAYGKKRDPEARLYPLRDLVHSTLTQLEVPGDVEIALEFPDDFMVDVDWYLMQRVFINILLNAIQAMPSGGRLTIWARLSGNKHVIKVSDTGVGISEENLKNLFKPLFTTKPKGTGLGLAVCKKIVESHDGSIDVESREGIGTVFTIALPAHDSEPARALPEVDVMLDPETEKLIS